LARLLKEEAVESSQAVVAVLSLVPYFNIVRVVA